MIPELGHVALILALCLAMIQGTIPLIGAHKGIVGWMQLARRAAWGQFVFMLIAFAALTTSFINNDFSVMYVANNSNTALPLQYRISAVWGAHEGSLLLWGFILAIWTVAVASLSRSLPLDTVARAISVMGLISIGFIMFMLFTSNPFDRIPIENIPANGRDLNPLLQDFGLVIHPPMLYMGYVGFSVAFAFAIAALLGGRLDATWARWSRPWTAMAWVFMTMGIALGSWWAYYELGWGGWWFWDPVENASFMPWLVGTALMHSLAVTEKRNAFKSWTVLLAIFAFSLSLLGTFLVRSGVLTSVHAFATDPERGVFILIFLLIVVGGSLLLYGWRAPAFKNVGTFKLFSRETFLLCNNVLLMIIMIIILLGTIYPLIHSALDWGKLSVGKPYFNLMSTPFAAALAITLGIGPFLRWKQDDSKQFFKKIRLPAIVSLILGTAVVALGFGELPDIGIFWTESVVAKLFTAIFGAELSASLTLWLVMLLVVFGVSLGCWIVVSIAFDLKHRLRHKANIWQALQSLPRSYYSMSIAHLGIAVFVIGVILTSTYSIERDVRMAPNVSLQLAGYDFKFMGIDRQKGPNYESHLGVVKVSKGGEDVVTLHPEKRYYFVQQNPMTEAAIDAGLFRDIYVSLGEPLPEGDAWAVRLYYKPFIRWVWLGALIMSFAGLLAATDKRYRLMQRREAELPVNAATAKA